MTNMSQSQQTRQSQFTINMEDQAAKVLKDLVDPLTTMLQVTVELASSTEEMSKLIVQMGTTTKKISESTNKLTNCTRAMLQQIKHALERSTHAIKPSESSRIISQANVKELLMNEVRQCQSEPGSNSNSNQHSAESIVLPKTDTFIQLSGLELKASDTMPISVRKGMFVRIIGSIQRILNQEILTSNQQTDLLMLQSEAARRLSKQSMQPNQS